MGGKEGSVLGKLGLAEVIQIIHHRVFPQDSRVTGAGLQGGKSTSVFLSGKLRLGSPVVGAHLTISIKQGHCGTIRVMCVQEVSLCSREGTGPLVVQPGELKFPQALQAFFSRKVPP